MNSPAANRRRVAMGTVETVAPKAIPPKPKPRKALPIRGSKGPTLTFVKTPPTKRELRDSERFYKRLGR